MTLKKHSFIHKIFSLRIPFVIKLYLTIAILAPLLANEKPLVVKLNNEYYFPAFTAKSYYEIPGQDGRSALNRTETINWKTVKSQFILQPIINWSAGKSDLENANYASPFSKQYFITESGQKKELPFSQRHFLGTTRTGEDVLAGLIHGTRISIIIGFVSMFIAGLIGIILGGIAGFLGDYKLKVTQLYFVYVIMIIIPAWYYSFTLQSESIRFYFDTSILMGLIRIILSGIIFCSFFIIPLLFKIKNNSNNFPFKKVNVPVDFLVMRMIELFLSLPRLVLILTIAAISKPSLITLIAIIGFTSWTDIARITRAEVLKLREVEFIQAERAIGQNMTNILFKHILPNIFPVIITVLIFGVASAILLETGLSFLGIGLPAGTVTWGTLMFAAKENFMAWWLVLFPGLAITALLISLNSYGKKLN